MSENESLARRGAWFGLLAAASSSPGQTFFIGLFGQLFRADLVISEAVLGTVYGLATLASGLLMFWLGELADRLALRRAITLSVAMVAAGSVLLAASSNVISLGAALFLLRLGGQGLSGHFAVVAAARFSERRRGRGVATAAMGFILGEALYPLLVTMALGLVDWRLVWAGIAALLLLVYLPALRWLARPFPIVQFDAGLDHGNGSRRLRVLLSKPFLATLGVVLVPAFVITAVFFHQGALAERLDWSAEKIAQAFVVFALCQAFATLLAGRLVDWSDARLLMRFYLLPLAAALAALVWLDARIALWLLFAGLGFTAGSNSVVAGAIWPEVFGTRRLGMIRGMYAAVMVISTAASPVLLGFLLARDIGLVPIFLPMIVYAIVVPLLLAPFTQTVSGKELSNAI